MWAWLRKYFCRTETIGSPVALPPPEPIVPAELVEALDIVRKSARVQSKLALKVDEIDEKLTRNIDDLSLTVDAAMSERPPLAWDDLLDAMDLLQHAVDGLDPAQDDGVADGLNRVLARLDRFLAQGALSRVGARGETVDGKLFRVIGTESTEDLPPGAIVRVVRAAAVRDGQCLREGAVITARSPS